MWKFKLQWCKNEKPLVASFKITDPITNFYKPWRNSTPSPCLVRFLGLEKSRKNQKRIKEVNDTYRKIYNTHMKDSLCQIRGKPHEPNI